MPEAYDTKARCFIDDITWCNVKWLWLVYLVVERNGLVILSRQARPAAKPSYIRNPKMQVVIYNWMSLPNKTTMLQELVLMVKAAEKVVNERKHVAAFGHLVILVRDVADKAEEIKAVVMGNEDTADLEWDAETAAFDRNRIRKRLKEVFKSIDVHTMPSPHPRIASEFLSHVGHPCLTLCVHHGWLVALNPRERLNFSG